MCQDDEMEGLEREDKKTGNAKTAKTVKTAGIVVTYILYALPIPLSVVSWIGTLMAVANLGATDWTTLSAWMHGSVAIVAMLAAGTYPVTYLVSLTAAIKDRSSAKRYWPLYHILAAIVLLALWTGLDH